MSEEEQERYIEKLAESQWSPSPTEEAFFTDLRSRGGLVGMDEAGQIVINPEAASFADAKLIAAKISSGDAVSHG